MTILSVRVTPFAGQSPGTPGVRRRFPALPGIRFGAFEIATADDFADTEPVDGSTGAHQRVRVNFTNSDRIFYRLSGTGTEGATLRVYLERCEPDPARCAHINGITGRDKPSVVA